MSIHCWIFDVTELSEPAVFSAALESLPWPERRERVMQFRFFKDRLLCLGAGTVCAYALRQAGAEDLRLSKGEYGKPALSACPDIHFNLSHSGNLAICAVSHHPVGADVQVMHKHIEGIAERICQSSEHDWLVCDGSAESETACGEFTEMSSGEYTETVSGEYTETVSGEYTETASGEFSEIDKRFTRLWARKESYIKLLGAGFFLDPSSFSVFPEGTAPAGAFFMETQHQDHLICVCSQSDAHTEFLPFHFSS